MALQTECGIGSRRLILGAARDERVDNLPTWVTKGPPSPLLPLGLIVAQRCKATVYGAGRHEATGPVAGDMG